MLFFDTNILVYAQDPAEPVKQTRARQLIESAVAEGSFTLSTQVLQEFYATVLRKQLLTPAAALALVRAWAEHEVVATTAALVVCAFELQQRHQLSVWDALIVQAALEAGCTALYSEDLQHRRQFDSLTVTNPFLAAPAVHEPPARIAKVRSGRR